MVTKFYSLAAPFVQNILDKLEDDRCHTWGQEPSTTIREQTCTKDNQDQTKRVWQALWSRGHTTRLTDSTPEVGIRSWEKQRWRKIRSEVMERNLCPAMDNKLMMTNKKIMRISRNTREGGELSDRRVLQGTDLSFYFNSAWLGTGFKCSQSQEPPMFLIHLFYH